LHPALFNCGPSDNSCYLGHTKNPDNDDDDSAITVLTDINVKQMARQFFGSGSKTTCESWYQVH